jgi:NADPH2:quinone reductase
VLTSPGDVTHLQVRPHQPAAPGKGEVRVRNQAIGTNFLDVYQRKGIYALPSYPAVLGAEAAGVVEAVGEGVTEFDIGDRVAYGGPPVGSYCPTRVLAASRVVSLPDAVETKMAAGSLLKGMTAYMLLRKTYDVQPGSIVLVHAAAGGLGSLLVRWAKDLGAVVIGTVGSDRKASLAVAYGADHVIVGRDIDLVTEIMRLTGDRGVDVAYDGIGGNTLLKSINSVRPFGVAVTIGQAAGPIPPVAVEELRPGKALSHPSIMAFCADPARYREAASAAISAMERGIVSAIGGEFDLRNAADAHIEMESGRATGSILLIP